MKNLPEAVRRLFFIDSPNLNHVKELEDRMHSHIDFRDVFQGIVTAQIQTSEALKGIQAVVDKPEPQRRSGASSFKVNLTMPTLHDSDFDFWKHWNACQNVARCQTAGAALDEMDFLSLWMPTFLPEGGVRAQTVKTDYDRACRKGRLPKEVGAVLVEMRDAVALLLRESDLEKAERLELMWNEISRGNSTHAEFRVKWVAMLDDIDDELPQVRDADSLYRRYLKAI